MDTAEGHRHRRTEESHEPGPESTGLFGSIRQVLATTLAVFHSRVELFAIELKEAKIRALSVIICAYVLIFLSVMMLVALMGTVVFLFWDQALAVLIGFSVFFFIAAVGSFFAARKHFNKMPFGETVAQLKKDQELVSEDQVKL